MGYGGYRRNNNYGGRGGGGGYGKRYGGYDRDKGGDTTEVSGTLELIKLDVKKEKANGDGYFRAHILKVKDSDGEVHKYVIGTKSRPAEYVDKLKKGQKVTIKCEETRFGEQVVAVFSGDKKMGGKSEYNPVGAIQGMVLKAAVDLAIATISEIQTDAEGSIIKAAKIILKTKSKVDKLVEKHLKSSDDDDDEDTDNEEDDEEEVEDSDDDEAEDEESDSEEEGDEDEAPSKAKKQKGKKKAKEVY